MIKRSLLIIALAAGFGSTSANAIDVTECALMLEADEARLACYDRLVTAEIKRQQDVLLGRQPTVEATVSAPTPAPKQAATSVPFKDRTFKRIDPADVRNTPEKWVNRDIEFATAQIYWVANDDLRILTKENMTLFGRAPLGDTADLAYLRENCETSKEAASAKCRVRVRFNFTRHAEDTPNGMYKRTVLVAPEVEFTRLGKGRR